MAERRQKIRGTSLQLDQDLGAAGLLAYDTERKELRVYDGVLLGGYRIPNLTTIDTAYKLPNRLTTTGQAYTGGAASANSALTNGFYYTDAATTDQPEAAAGTILVNVSAAGTVITQTWTRGSNGAQYTRVRNAALVWSAWNRVIDKAYLLADPTVIAYDAARLGGQLPAYYTAINARLGYTAANKAGEAFTGNVSVGGTFGVTGAVTLASSLTAANTSVSTLGVTGSASVGTTLGVGGLATLASLSVSGSSTLASLTVTTNQTIGGNLTVNGTSTTLNTTLAVTGTTTLAAMTATVITGTQLVVNQGGEAIRLISPNDTSDTYIAWYKTIAAVATRQAYIQHTDGASDGAGLIFVNDLSDDRIALNNAGGINALRFYDATTALYNTVWHSGNDGASSGLSADDVDGYHASDLYRDNASFSTTGNLVITNSAPEVKLLDSTASQLSCRMRVDANNVYFDSSADDVVFAEVFRFELDTKNGYANGSLIWTDANTTSARIIAELGFTPASAAISIVAGNGMTGGGTLAASRTVTLGTPLPVSNTSTDSVTATQHSHSMGATFAEVYTGSTAAQTVFPVGHEIICYTDGNIFATNAAAVPCLSSIGTNFYRLTGTPGASTALSGTWRARGMIGADYIHLQKVT